MGSNSPTTVELDGCISCRLYEDNRPHNLEISSLQKGLVLLVNGKEVIEEGAGFGTPVVIYRDKPYFSSSAETSMQREEKNSILFKSFKIDTVSRKRFLKNIYLNDRFYHFIHGLFHIVYTRSKKFAPFLMVPIKQLRTFGIGTEFQKTDSKGEITVKYSCFTDLIEVEVAFSQLDLEGCEEILILNEQGASSFRKYLDTNGLTLLDGQIGAWEPAKAERVFLFNIEETAGFSLESKTGATLFRGREKIRERYSWVGFCYSLHPRVPTFRYSISLLSDGRKNKSDNNSH